MYLWQLIIYAVISVLSILLLIYIIKYKKKGILRRLAIGLILICAAAYPIYFHDVATMVFNKPECAT